jgi:hypothetical protein
LSLDKTTIEKRITAHIKFTEHARLAMRDDNLTTVEVLEAMQNF